MQTFFFNNFYVHFFKFQIIYSKRCSLKVVIIRRNSQATQDKHGHLDKKKFKKKSIHFKGGRNK